MPDLRVVESPGEVPEKKAKARGPRRSKAERDAIKSARLALMADAQVDEGRRNIRPVDIGPIAGQPLLFRAHGGR